MGAWIFGYDEDEEERMKVRFDRDKGPIRMLMPLRKSEGKCFLEGGDDSSPSIRKANLKKHARSNFAIFVSIGNTEGVGIEDGMDGKGSHECHDSSFRQSYSINYSWIMCGMMRKERIIVVFVLPHTITPHIANCTFQIGFMD